MKTAIVTGAGGFIGGALTKELLRRGWKVYGADIRPITGIGPCSEFVPIRAGVQGTNIAKFVAEKVDCVFNLALLGTMNAPDLYNAELQIENISVAVRLFEQVAPICKRFLFVSSSYESLKDGKRPDLPLCPYGIAKRAAAEMCASNAYRNGIELVKVILTNTFGVGDRSDKAVNTLIRAMLENRPLNLVEGGNKNDWTYIDDTVSGLIAAAENGHNFGKYYIGHRDITTFREKVTAMRDVLNPSMPLKFGTMPESTYVDYSAFDLDALYRDTGFECQADFRESIKKTAGWLKEQMNEDVKKSLRGGVTSKSVISVRGAVRKAAAA